MIYTINSNNTFTLDMTNSLKTSYPYNAEVWLNGAKIAEGATGTLLPYTTALPEGVNSIEIKLFSVNGSYREFICRMNDIKLYCALLKRIEGLTPEERLKDTSLILFYILSKGLDSDNCSCACPNLKLIYTDLNDILNPQTCC